MGLETPSCKKTSCYRNAFKNNSRHLSSWEGRFSVENTDDAVRRKLEDSGSHKADYPLLQPVLVFTSSCISFKYFYHIKLLVVKAQFDFHTSLIS